MYNACIMLFDFTKKKKSPMVGCSPTLDINKSRVKEAKNTPMFILLKMAKLGSGPELF